MAYALWDQLFGTATESNVQIVKALYGCALFRDWNYAATDLATYSPFDPITGNLSDTILTTDGWTDAGFLSENGVAFTPKYTTVDTMVWQSRLAQRTDVTVDQEEILTEFMEPTPFVEALHDNMPLAQAAAIGTIGWSYTKPLVPQMIARQMMVLGVDGNDGNNQYFCNLYPRVLLTKIDKFSYDAKNPLQYACTWDSYLDPFSGFAIRRFREGPAWRASGGNTAVTGTPVATVTSTVAKATLTFTPPTTQNTPFTFQVNQILATVSTALLSSQIVIASSSPTSVVLTLSGLTSASSLSFTVQATGSNGSQSVPSAASNSVTIP